jgi:hypothetical protein
MFDRENDFFKIAHINLGEEVFTVKTTFLKSLIQI